MKRYLVAQRPTSPILGTYTIEQISELLKSGELKPGFAAAEAKDDNMLPSANESHSATWVSISHLFPDQPPASLATTGYTFRCPHCQILLTGWPRNAESDTKCPACNKWFLHPSPPFREADSKPAAADVAPPSTKSSRHRVNPRPYTPASIPPVTQRDRDRAARAASAHFGGVAIVLIGVTLIAASCIIGFVPTVIAMALLLLGFYLATRRTETARFAKERIQAEQMRIISEQESAEAEARSLTTTLVVLHEAAPNQAQTLLHYLQRADSDLQVAENDFRDGAFAPFWDAIERTAISLSCFDEVTHQLTVQADRYYTSLRDRDHTFPQFPVDITALPDPSHTTDRMQALVRKAQCNFQFAMIYEQRKTNNILKHGFMSLASAISELGTTLSDSMDGLRESLSSGLADISNSVDSAAAAARTASEELITEIKSGNKEAASNAHQQERRDQEAAKMLDNIQRHRKPSPRQPGDGAH